MKSAASPETLFNIVRDIPGTLRYGVHNGVPNLTVMAIAGRYNEAAARLLPHMAADLAVDTTITDANHIDEIVFRRSEFLGGMAVAILAMIERKG